MRLILNRESKTPLFMQIYEALAARIRSNTLKKGEQLPTGRKLAQQLDVSYMTIVKAYNQLEHEGLIERIQGKGTFVAGVGESKEHMHNESSPHNPYEWQLSIPDFLPRTQYNRYYNVTGEEINLSVSAIYPRLFPNHFFTEKVAEILKNDPYILSQYGEVQGITPLREAVAKDLEKSDLHVSPSEIIITSGTHQGIDLVARSIIGPGDVVMTEVPTYPAAIDLFRNRGATIIPIPMEFDGMNIKQLERAIEKHKPNIIYTIPTYQNPTGIVMSLNKRKRLLEIAQQTDCLIIEDDPWSELYFDSPPPPPLKSLDQTGHVIYLKGLSKFLAPGCRIGIMVANGVILNRLIEAKANTDLGSPTLTQMVVLSLLNTDRMKNHIKKLRVTMEIRRDIMIDYLRKSGLSEDAWIVPKGGLNIWLTLPPWVNSEELLLESIKKNVSFLPGTTCYPGQPQSNQLRLSYSYVSEHDLAVGMEQFAHILSKYLSQASSSGSTISIIK